MPFRFGWFSTGRDEAARKLLEVVTSQISRGVIPGEIAYVFCNRQRGEAEESDRFIELAESLGLRLKLFSSRGFRPSLRYENRETWREEFHEEVARRIQTEPVEVIVLAGYMLILSQAFCESFAMINLHPAAPGGPKGTWQEVIWSLIRQGATETGVMIHLVTKDLDEGPSIAYVTFPIRGPSFDPLWGSVEEKLRTSSFEQWRHEEGEGNLLFQRIRREGVRRELPLMVMTLKALAEKEVSICQGRVLDRQGRSIKGICLNEEVESYLRDEEHKASSG